MEQPSSSLSRSRHENNHALIASTGAKPPNGRVGTSLDIVAGDQRGQGHWHFGNEKDATEDILQVNLMSLVSGRVPSESCPWHWEGLRDFGQQSPLASLRSRSFVLQRPHSVQAEDGKSQDELRSSVSGGSVKQDPRAPVPYPQVVGPP